MTKQQQILKQEKDNRFRYQLLENEEEIAFFTGFFHEPHLASLTSNGGSPENIIKLGNHFFSDCQKHKINILVHDVPNAQNLMEWLYGVGFTINYKKRLYYKELKEFQYQEEGIPPFVFRSLNQLDEGFFKELFYEGLEGDPLNQTTDQRMTYLKEIMDRDDFNTATCNLVYLKEEPIGFILAGVITDSIPNEVEGVILHIGILPAFRKKGLGQQLHYRAIQYLKEIGATIYYGSTASTNEGMIKIFEKNGCEMKCEQLYLEAKNKEVEVIPIDKKKARLATQYNYPIAPSKPITEDYFGTKITDHYRNLESLEDPEVQKWFKAQGAYTENILDSIPERDTLLQKMEDFHQRKAYFVSNINVTRDDQCFFLKQQQGAEAAQLFYRKDEHSEDELLYDPKDYKPETQKNYIISEICPSWDGRYVAIAISHSGLEINEMVIMDMTTRKILPQIISHYYSNITWFPNNRGFTYIHRPVIDVHSEGLFANTEVVRYYIGDDPKELDIFFSKDTHPQLNITSADYVYVDLFDPLDQYILGAVFKMDSPYSEIYYTTVKELEHGIPHWKPLLTVDDQAEYGILVNDTFFFKTVKNTPNGQIRSITIGRESVGTSTLLVDTKADTIIDDFEVTSEGLYFTRIKNGVESKLYQVQEGKEIVIPFAKPAGRISLSNKGGRYPDIWITTSGWLNDYTRYKYVNQQLIEANLTLPAQYPEFENFVVKEVLVTSHDGEEVPLSIIHQKGIELNGQHPTIMEGYGSHNFSLKPHFGRRDSLAWVAQGGIYCVAHVRGGGEKGEAWYEAGRKANKPNTWKDFIACTEYLINENYTCPEKMAIWGKSSGGITIGRAMTARPDLYAVVLLEVGVMNTLRAEKMPNTYYATLDYGMSINPIECKGLIEMDAYLQLQEGVEYPATLITAGMNDPRVPAWQPGKFAAKLQAYNTSNKPTIFWADYGAGHGVENIHSQKMKSLANVLAFAFWQLNHPIT